MLEKLERQRQFYASGITKDVPWRIKQLKYLKKQMKKYEASLLDALTYDLGKSSFEGYVTEVAQVYSEIDYAVKHVEQWAADVEVATPLHNKPAKSYICTEPLGLVLILSPWNYPVQLVLSPLVAAIAAGNCVALKPSEQAGHTEKVIFNLLAETFDPQFVSVYLGAVEMSQELLKQPFDHILYTGNTEVGKLVMRAAAEHLTPVTLELGGKCPCIVDDTADIELTAKRIIWGKCLNSGQTCVAPDYVLVDRKVKNQLVEAMVAALDKQYPGNILENKDYGRIINRRHYERLLELMQEGNIIAGGTSSPEQLKIAPTLIDQVPLDSKLMKDEIFGPILPIISFDELDAAVALIQQRPKPLAVYIFTQDPQIEQDLIQRIPFGGGCINDTVLHVSNVHLPFGGIGHSGMGSYHGQAGFDTFSHKKSIFKQSNSVDVPFRYAPYGNKINVIKKIMN